MRQQLLVYLFIYLLFSLTEAPFHFLLSTLLMLHCVFPVVGLIKDYLILCHDLANIANLSTEPVANEWNTLTSCGAHASKISHIMKSWLFYTAWFFRSADILPTILCCLILHIHSFWPKEGGGREAGSFVPLSRRWWPLSSNLHYNTITVVTREIRTP